MGSTVRTLPPRTRGAVATGLTLAAAFVLAAARPVLGHPLGNFSINHYAGITAGAHSIEIRYVIDMAEIPTFQEIREHQVVPADGDPSALPYLAAKVDELRRGLTLEVSGRPADLALTATGITFPPGVGGLPTTRLEASLRAVLPLPASGAPIPVRYRDTNFEGRAGWKEIVVVAGAGTTLLFSSAPATDRSQQLAAYPVDLLNSPPQDLEARFTFATPQLSPIVASTKSARPPSGGSPPAPSEPVRAPRELAPVPKKIEEPQSRSASRSDLGFMELISLKELSPAVVLSALLLAFALGAFHALEPGHGKTVVAAYLVGSRGTARHALLLGLIVTASHTAGVYLLGLITLGASAYVVPERLYPWLTLLSALAIVGLGATLLVRGWRVARGRPPLVPGHAAGPAGDHHFHDHGHAHGGLSHSHGPGSHHHGGHWHSHGHGAAYHHHGDLLGPSVSSRALLILGITGGIIPCPAALVVLLSAIGLGRVGFGLLLIVAFSAGLALVLIGIGLLTVSARRLMSRVRGEGPLLRWLPVFSSAAMILLGLGLTAQVLVSGGL